MTGYIISNKIIHIIKRARLGMEECRRKRCDEASIMLAEVVGLETCTKQLYEKAMHPHCHRNGLYFAVG